MKPQPPIVGEANDPAGDGVGLSFAIPLAYEGVDDSGLGPAARALGLACVLLGTLRFFIGSPLQIMSTIRQWKLVPPTQQASFRAIFIASLIVSLILNAVGIAAGIAATRLRASAVHALWAWAWCSIAYAILGMIINIWFNARSFAGSAQTAVAASWICYSAERLLSGLTLPLVTLVLLRSRSFRNAFMRGQPPLAERSRN